MPDFWTHIIAGEEIAAQISDQNITKLLNTNYQFYNFSCQGADFFFYNNFWPWSISKKGVEKGDKIHQLSGKKLFSQLLTEYKKDEIYYNKEIPAENLAANKLIYLLGFISHYAVDRECHPYIINNGGKGAEHKLIEIKIDLYLTEKKWNKSAAEINPLPYYQLKKDHEESIYYFYQCIFNSLFEEDLERDLIWDSYLDLRKYHKLFFANKKGKINLFKMLNSILPQNLNQYSYDLALNERVWSEEKFTTFEKKLKKGIKSALFLIEQTLAYLKSEISLTEVCELYTDLNFVGEKT